MAEFRISAKVARHSESSAQYAYATHGRRRQSMSVRTQKDRYMPFYVKFTATGRYSTYNDKKIGRHVCRPTRFCVMQKCYLTAFTIASNAFGSFIAKSARTLRLRAMPLALILPINSEYVIPWARTAALIRVIHNERNVRFLSWRCA